MGVVLFQFSFGSLELCQCPGTSFIVNPLDIHNFAQFYQVYESRIAIFTNKCLTKYLFKIIKLHVLLKEHISHKETHYLYQKTRSCPLQYFKRTQSVVRTRSLHSR